MPPTKKNLKATKKFEKKHLSNTLAKRKDGAKAKQRNQIKAKKQLRKSKDEGFYKGDKPEDASQAKKQKDANVSGMSVDDFFQGGFEDIINQKQPNGKGKNDDGKLGKRKRDGTSAKVAAASDDDDDRSDDDMSLEEQPVMSDGDDDDGDDGGDSELGEDGNMSKKAMDDLARKDPEFYKFLRENDPEALDFDENADLAEVDELSAGSDDDDSEQPKKKRKQDAKKKSKSKKGEDDSDDDEDAAASAFDNELTQEMVAKWKTAMAEKKSLRAARQVVLAFRCAAHLNEDDEEAQKARYTINSPQVFHDVLIAALKQIPEVIHHHLPVKESASGKVYVSTETKKFSTLSIMLKTYTASIIHLLGTLSDDATLKLTISALEPILPFLLSFRKLLKALIKTVVNFWARPASSETTKITAFLVMRKLMVIGDSGIRETILKATYQGLVQGSRVTNINTIQGINLMKNSASELWGIDQSVGYTTAFTFIRQLAIHLRNSIVNNKDAAHRVVCCWQYLHSLDFWSNVLAEHCSTAKTAESGGKDAQLKLLIYPLTQVTLGAARLIPTATYFPFRFHLIRSLLRVSRATNTYIPLASMLLEVLESAEMRRNPRPASLKPLDFRVAYKAPKSYLRTRVYQDGVGEQLVELFSEYFALWCKNIAFPEMSLPVIIQLKRWLKHARRGAGAGGVSHDISKAGKPGAGGKKAGKKGGAKGGNRNAKLMSSLVVLVQKLEANARFIEEKRSKIDFAPKDRAQVDSFLRELEWEKTPVGAFVVSQRKLREEKLRLMDEARKDDERRRKEERGGDDDDVVVSDGDDVESNAEGDDDDEEGEFGDELMDGYDDEDMEDEE